MAKNNMDWTKMGKIWDVVDKCWDRKAWREVVHQLEIPDVT